VPSDGPAGSELSINGAGFARGRRVSVTARGALAVRRTVSRRGTFALRLALPAGAKGRVPLSTRQGRARVSNLFVVGGVPAGGEVATVGGAALRWRVRGDVLVLAGRGLRRSHRVRTTLRGFGATVRTDRHGRFRRSLPIPAAAPRVQAGSVRDGHVVLPFRFRLPASAADPKLPIRAAFYYPWFPEAWSQKGINPFTNFRPSSGFYSSDDGAVLRRHIEEMRYAKVDAGIASWWGQGSRTDRRIPALLTAAAGTGFRWALYHEGEGQGDPSAAALRSDLAYIRAHYANDPSYLRIGGRFVVFVYSDANDAAGMAERWKQANDGSAYVVLKVFSGYRSAAAQPDAWHQYAPARADDSQPGQSFAVSPGFWLAGEQPRLERDLTRFAQSVRAMVASAAPWQLVTTFNEWGEGTSVEPAEEWRSGSGYGSYLDVLHADGR
jgi:hypothetical protein